MVTQSDVQKHGKQFGLLSALYPLLWAVARMTALLWFQPGYKLIVQARRLPEES